MATITVTNLQGHTSGGDANKVKIASGQTLDVNGTLDVTGATVTGNLPAANLTGALPAISGAALTGISQDMVLLSTQTEPTAAGTFTINLDTTGTYAEQIIVFAGWYQMNLIDSYLRVVEGGSVVSSSGSYQYITSGYNVGQNPGVFGNNSTTVVRTNWYSSGDSANETNDLIVHVRHAESSTQRTMLTGTQRGLAGNAAMTDNYFVGRRSSAAVATGLHLTSSNAASNYVFANGGYIKHYGVK